ncbi:unnamed protein product [Durusdinium trenchii]
MDVGAEKMFRPNNLELGPEETGPRPLDSLSGKLGFAPPARSYTLRAGCRIQVFDLKRQTELNGSMGVALEWVQQIERWKVVLDDGSSLLLRPAHLTAVGKGWDSASAQTCE